MKDFQDNDTLEISCLFAQKTVKGNVKLPFSKSESNRALMIAAYGRFPLEINDLSDANDTVLLQKLLCSFSQGASVFDCEDAGTVARFLMTFLAGKQGEWTLTGSPRLCQRPMGDLVAALCQLGASVEYLGNDDCLPVKIKGVDIQGGKVILNVEKSSQFASSLLLAAPMWPKGLKLHLLGQLNSLPYIDMTIAMMQNAGANSFREKTVISVDNVPYQFAGQKVSADWSAASYWFELAALSDDCDLLLENLSFDSLQGDAAIAEMMRFLGVDAIQEKSGIRLKKKLLEVGNPVFDFSETPDLFPTVVATCAGLKLKASFKGIKNLALKESDRVAAMAEELQKIGATLVRLSDNEAFLSSFENTSRLSHFQQIVFDSHNDHRIAMALAPLVLVFDSFSIENPNVVSKSYPNYWDEILLCLCN